MLFFNKCYELWFYWSCLGLGFCLLKFHWNDVTRWICYIDKLTLCFVMFFSHIIYIPQWDYYVIKVVPSSILIMVSFTIKQVTSEIRQFIYQTKKYNV